MICSLIVIGGIGFVVWDDIYNLVRHKKHISTYSKLVLRVTAVLIVSGTVLMLIFEWNNPDSIGTFPAWKKIIASLFQSITTRTAGFSTINLCGMREITKFLFMALMFIGGASGSTAGGIKVGTFGLAVITIWHMARGKSKVTLNGHSVSNQNVLRAFCVIGIQLSAILLGAAIIMLYGHSMTDVLFEVFSAAGTVGLSLSLTPLLEAIPKIVLMILMFFGRVGIFTFTVSFITRAAKNENLIDLTQARLLIG